MRLERLEISGFKSFSDRSELAFDQGVTAIVGPNGCGKSNVADAITWVLGEQSAKSLRGEKMEDVIFSGSDARKPTGAAEVRLKLSGVIVPPSLAKEMGGELEPFHGHTAHAGNGNGNGNGHSELGGMLAPVTRDVEVTRRLFRLMVKKRGRNLRAGQADQWTEEWFNGHGLHRLRGTIRYPKAA